jgi:hypothetical protein
MIQFVNLRRQPISMLHCRKILLAAPAVLYCTAIARDLVEEAERCTAR